MAKECILTAKTKNKKITIGYENPIPLPSKRMEQFLYWMINVNIPYEVALVNWILSDLITIDYWG